MEQFEVKDEEIQDLLYQIGSMIQNVTSQHGYGFVFILSKLGGERCFYIGNIQREDTIKIMDKLKEKFLNGNKEG